MSPDDPRTTEGLTHESAPLRAVVRECRLTRIENERDVAIHTFAADRMVVGADPRADLVVADPTMSKFHCELRVIEGVCVVRDLGSRNGTLVDRVPILEAPLRSGAILTIGRTQLRFDVGARDVEIPLSQRDHFGRLRGGSVAMRAIYALLEAAAGGISSVLLQG